jgi:MaoC like domain
MKKNMLSIGSFSITPSESLSFSSISGDYNPLHIDPVIALDSQFGATLIHGVHGTLCALESYFKDQQQPLALTSLTVMFKKPVQHGDKIDCMVDYLTSTSARIELQCEGKRVQIIELCFLPLDHPRANVEPVLIPEDSVPPKPRIISMGEADAQLGDVPLVWNPLLFAEMFPQLARLLPDSQSATILGTSKTVGMICPGLNAIYTRFNLSFDVDPKGPASPLHYKVVSTDPRFSRIIMAVHNLTGSGEIEAFLRACPTDQTRL